MEKPIFVIRDLFSHGAKWQFEIESCRMRFEADGKLIFERVNGDILLIESATRPPLPKKGERFQRHYAQAHALIEEALLQWCDQQDIRSDFHLCIRLDELRQLPSTLTEPPPAEQPKPRRRTHFVGRV